MIHVCFTKTLIGRSLSSISNLLFFLRIYAFFPKTFLGNSFLDIYKCPFFEKGEKMFQKEAIVTIMNFYGLVNKKIISTL